MKLQKIVRPVPALAVLLLGIAFLSLAAGQARANNIERLLADPKVTKLFHFARFDVAVLFKTFGIMAAPVYCTKIASKLARTYTDRHGLKDLTRELLGVELSKQQQSTDWGDATLSEAQLSYAASNVLYLHALRIRLDAINDGFAALRSGQAIRTVVTFD